MSLNHHDHRTKHPQQRLAGWKLIHLCTHKGSNIFTYILPHNCLGYINNQFNKWEVFLLSNKTFVSFISFNCNVTSFTSRVNKLHAHLKLKHCFVRLTNHNHSYSLILVCESGYLPKQLSIESVGADDFDIFGMGPSFEVGPFEVDVEDALFGATSITITGPNTIVVKPNCRESEIVQVVFQITGSAAGTVEYLDVYDVPIDTYAVSYLYISSL